MDQLTHAFGLDIRLIIVQVINFVALAAALTYFLYKPVLKILQDREDKIATGLKDAEEAALAKANTEEAKQEILAKAHHDAEEVSKNAKVFADEKAGEIVASAEARAADLIEDATFRASEIADRTKKESEAEIAKLAILAAEKVLRDKKTS